MFGKRNKLASLLGIGNPEHDYTHSRPEDYIDSPDYDGIGKLLVEAEKSGAAYFNHEEFAKARPSYSSDSPQTQIRSLVLSVSVTRNKLEDGLKKLKEAKKNVGNLLGNRPKSGWTNLEQIKTQNELDHQRGAGLLQFVLQIEALKAYQAELDVHCDKLTSLMPHFRHDDVQRLLKHNIMCVQNQSAQISGYLDKLDAVNSAEYNRLTAWISVQWERFIGGIAE